MDAPPAPTPAASPPSGTDPRHHVAPRLLHVPNWEVTYGDRNAFRVRGLSWFRSAVERDIDKLKQFISQMEAIRPSRPAWATRDFAWDAKFSIAQVYAARRGRALRFEKAAKVLLLCEVVAAEQGIPPSVVYGKMRIEPALFGITDFTEDSLSLACDQCNNLLPLLRQGTGQNTEKVFVDMAEGKAVSYRLAWLTRELLASNVPAISWGNVIIIPNRLTKPKFEVTGREEVEAASVPTGAPDTFQP